MYLNNVSDIVYLINLNMQLRSKRTPAGDRTRSYECSNLIHRPMHDHSADHFEALRQWTFIDQPVYTICPWQYRPQDAAIMLIMTNDQVKFCQTWYLISRTISDCSTSTELPMRYQNHVEVDISVHIWNIWRSMTVPQTQENYLQFVCRTHRPNCALISNTKPKQRHEPKRLIN